MILVIDVGTTSVRVSLIDGDGRTSATDQLPFAPHTPAPGLVEFDATELAELVVAASNAAIDRAGGSLEGVGITSQRATTVVWDRSTGRPIGPALGWQDLRTVGECLVARAEHDVEIAPNQSATKIGWLIANRSDGVTGDDLAVGTVDSWLAWTLSGGRLHVTDHTNAGVTGLYDVLQGDWSEHRCRVFGVDAAWLPRLVDSTGEVGPATALRGAPPIVSIVGDQQASLVGQACTRPGMAKITFGTGAMLDLCIGDEPPASPRRGGAGTFPIVAWADGGALTWGVEAIMLAAGSNVDWLRDDLGLIGSSAESHDVAAECHTTDGVVFVPALLGLGTPHWDFGARGTLLGATRGTTRAHVVRAVLEGVAQRGADLVEAAESDTGRTIEVLRVDGGMSQNPTFVQALADATGRPVDVAPVVEATTAGAARLAEVALGRLGGIDDVHERWQPAHTVDPVGEFDRERWRRGVERAAGWIPELSALDF